jgi:hypothetical protein
MAAAAYKEQVEDIALNFRRESASKGGKTPVMVAPRKRVTMRRIRLMVYRTVPTKPAPKWASDST